jgi:hypothetical protein
MTELRCIHFFNQEALMRLAFALLPCLFLFATLRAQAPPCSACATSKAGLLPQGRAVCLTDKEMVAHIAASKPVAPPGLNEPHMNIRGTVVACVCFSPKGVVTDIRSLSGPAMMQQSVLESLKEWTFYPVNQGGKLNGGCGTLRIHIDMIDSQVTTSIEE